MNDHFLHHKLNKRKEADSFRKLIIRDGFIDFCSNDYLGLAKINFETPGEIFQQGSTGSRLLSGNYELIEKAERTIATFHDAQAGLIYNSGYDANVGLLSCIAQKVDTILYDHLSHASIRDGIRLSFAGAHSFRHNDMDDLEGKLKSSEGNIFIVTESVFSMDGDFCPLEDLVNLSEKYNAYLIIDEAHATGVIGEKGEGLVQHLKLQDKCFARIHTFGKGVGSHGAIVLGSHSLRDYLINFSRPFIYSTALPEYSIAHLLQAYQNIQSMHVEREHLYQLIYKFSKADLPFEKLKSSTPIQGLIIPGNKEVKSLAKKFEEEKIDIRPILYPTVPKGAERLRIILHSFNTLNEVDKMINILNSHSL